MCPVMAFCCNGAFFVPESNPKTRIGGYSKSECLTNKNQEKNMEHEELVKLVKELEMRVAVLERRDSAGSRENCQEECGIQSRVKEERKQET